MSSFMSSAEDGWLVRQEFRLDCQKKGLATKRPTLVVWNCTNHDQYPTTSEMRQERERAIKTWAGNRWERSSTHFVIMRDGTVFQMMEIGKFFAWHAGLSQYKGNPAITRPGQKVTVNPFSIGVSFDNCGALVAVGGQWLRADKRHRFMGPVTSMPEGKYHFEEYTPEQRQAAVELAKRLHRFFGKLDHVGLSEIDTRKQVLTPGLHAPISEAAGVLDDFLD